MSKQKVNCAKGTREADLGHAVLSASGSHRWLNCTPSARLELEFENTTSEAAREGTAAHALPVSINGGAEKYSVSVLIPKDDTETVNAVNKAIDAAIEEGCCKIRR